MTRSTDKMLSRLTAIGLSYDDATQCIALRLHRWHELECGVENGGVERDEKTGKVFWYSSHTGKRSPYRDNETPALKRLEKIKARYPGHEFYVQGDPRGAALFVLSPYDVERRKALNVELDAYYSNGVAVF